MFHPTEAYRFVSESIAGRCEVVSLVEKDYLATLESAAKAGLCGGILYDALQLRRAEKARCDRIYTFDISHFVRLAPHLGDKILRPERSGGAGQAVVPSTGVGAPHPTDQPAAPFR